MDISVFDKEDTSKLLLIVEVKPPEIKDEKAVEMTIGQNEATAIAWLEDKITVLAT